MSRSTASRASRRVCSTSRLPWIVAGIGTSCKDRAKWQRAAPFGWAMTWGTVNENAAEPDRPIPSHVERILDAARIAPSLDNLQPWRFVVEGETISFLVDHERDRTSPISGGRMARVAVGAALDCALLRAGRMGATVRFEA